MAGLFKKIVELSKKGITLEINPILIAKKTTAHTKKMDREQHRPDRLADIEFIFTNINPGQRKYTSFCVTYELFEQCQDELLDIMILDLIDKAIIEVL